MEETSLSVGEADAWGGRCQVVIFSHRNSRTGAVSVLVSFVGLYLNVSCDWVTVSYVGWVEIFLSENIHESFGDGNRLRRVSGVASSAQRLSSPTNITSKSVSG